MKEINGIKLYTCNELSELFGVSPQTIYKYIRQGNIVNTRIGRSLYVSEQNIIDYLNGKTKKRTNSTNQED